MSGKTALSWKATRCAQCRRVQSSFSSVRRTGRRAMNDYGAMLTWYKVHKNVIIFTKKTTEHDSLRIVTTFWTWNRRVPCSSLNHVTYHLEERFLCTQIFHHPQPVFLHQLSPYILLRIIIGYYVQQPQLISNLNQRSWSFQTASCFYENENEKLRKLPLCDLNFSGNA